MAALTEKLAAEILAGYAREQEEARGDWEIEADGSCYEVVAEVRGGETVLSVLGQDGEVARFRLSLVEVQSVEIVAGDGG